METRSTFLWLVLSLSLFLTTSCQNLRLRTDQPSLPGEPVADQKNEVEQKPPATPPEARPPEFIRQPRAKIGLILGPGGALTYAHIGLLQELENQKIPIHAIAGMEWGALVAATYASLGKSHGVEWKLLKFPVEAFEKKGFFGSGRNSPPVEELNGFLKETFEGKVVSRGSTGFTCPLMDLSRLATRMAAGITFEERVRQCWPHPPHFKINKSAAQLMAVQQTAQALKGLGADRIVYVDVLSQNQLGSLDSQSDQMLWALARSQNLQGVDHVIQLQVSGGGLTMFREARSLIRQGQLKSKAIVQDLGRQYAF